MPRGFLTKRHGTNIFWHLVCTCPPYQPIVGNGVLEEHSIINVILILLLIKNIKSIVPVRNASLTADKTIHKISRDECIKIINRHNNTLEPDR